MKVPTKINLIGISSIVFGVSGIEGSIFDLITNQFDIGLPGVPPDLSTGGL